jgi:glycine cleavage system aminomethyltransferase T
VITPVRRSPIARLQVEEGARFDAEGDWEIPASFADPDEERDVVREAVGLADVSARGKVDLQGEIDDLVADPGGAIVARIGRGCAMLFTEPGGEARVLERCETAAGRSTMVTDATHLFAGFALVGPRTPAVIARLTSWDPATLAPGDATAAPLAEVRAVVVRGAGDPSVVEAYVETESARYVWETLLGVVRGLGGGPIGMHALRAEGWR